MKKQTLYDISSDLMALRELLDESGGELTPETEPIFDQFFAELTAAQGEKLDGYIGLIRQFEMESATAKAESEQWGKKAQAKWQAVARLKDRLKMFLELTGQQKVQTERGRTVAIQANGGNVPVRLAFVIDLDTVPDRFKKVKVEIDTDAVREALQAGEVLDFASLGERGTHLRIR